MTFLAESFAGVVFHFQRGCATIVVHQSTRQENSLQRDKSLLPP
jgi:hypothetical protein